MKRSLCQFKKKSVSLRRRALCLLTHFAKYCMSVCVDVCVYEKPLDICQSLCPHNFRWI